MISRPRFLPDNFVLALLSCVTLAAFFPADGRFADVLDKATWVAVSLLFFLHGAKLSREAVVAGMLHWRLHLMVLGTTFVLFPLFGLVLQPLLSPLIGSDLMLGVLFLCVLPSTVQSSIALTSVARGNLPAAVCSASASNLLGIFLTPLLVGMVLAARDAGGTSLDSVLKIVVQLLVPFIAGQLARPLISGWVARQKNLVKVVDQGAILMVVYTAFSAATIAGLWQQLQPEALAGVLLADAVLLALALGSTALFSRLLGFNRADQSTTMFCGSQKSLASGVPIAKVLFAAPTVGAMVLPLMLFHQMQLMVCAVLANRHARRSLEDEAAQKPAGAT